jgi:hypothetical protein
MDGSFAIPLPRLPAAWTAGFPARFADYLREKLMKCRHPGNWLKFDGNIIG